MKQKHKTTVRVRGYELDSYGHVNNAEYVRYYEAARWEMMNDLGFLDRLKDSGLSVVIVESYIRYMRELTMFDEVVIESSFEEKSPFLVFHQKMTDAKSGIPVSRAKFRTVFIGKEKIPQDIPSFLTSSQS